MPPKVSVLLTVLNGERFLQAAVESILSQTFRDFEFIAADDGSTDNSWAILSQCGARDSRVQLVRREQNHGITRSMNDLFARAQGEYITRHDADDVSQPERLAQQVAFLDAHAAVGLLGSRVDSIGPDDRPLNIQPYFNVGLNNAELQPGLMVHNCLCQGSVMFRAELLRQVGVYDESLEPAEDYDLWLRMAEVTQLAKLEGRLYQYRHHAESMTRSRKPHMHWQHARVLDKTVHRRYGASPAAPLLAPVARAYVEAAILKARAGEHATAQASTLRALKLCPAVLAQNAALLDELLAANIYGCPVEASQSFINAVFGGLPASLGLRRQRSRWLARPHMRAVFASATDGPAREAHLWAGLRLDPTWLFNRGVAAIAARAVTRRFRPPRRRGSP